MQLADLITNERQISVIGLAKNTGKTEALNALARELSHRRETIGVTSIGRDGEERDVLDHNIEKPQIRLAAKTLIATTEDLVRKSGLRVQRLRETGLRTPLGRIVIGRLVENGNVEIAGPSAASDIRAVSDMMLELGTDRILIDGAINRRASASPVISDGVIVATGAVLGAQVDEIVGVTRDAVELFEVPKIADPAIARIAGALPTSAIITEGGEIIPMEGRQTLTGIDDASPEIKRNLRHARCIVVRESLLESFIDAILQVTRMRPILFAVDDSTKVFLSQRRWRSYMERGVRIEVLRPMNLMAITVNPVAPRSHAFDPRNFRECIQRALPGLRVFDVMDPNYLNQPT